MTPEDRTPSVYLDHAASAPPVPKLYERWGDLAREVYTNPHGTTQYSAHCKKLLYNAERRVLEALRIPQDEASIIWTSGGTEGINLAVHGILAGAGEGCCLVDSGGHSAILACCDAFSQQSHRDLLKIPLDRHGRLGFDGLGSPVVALTAVTHVNNETGAVGDLVACGDALGGLSGRRVLLVDAMQSVGKMPIPWRRAGIDLLVVGGRKIGGPPGIGALVVRKGIEVEPLMFGGGQQGGLRPGTLDTAAIVSFADVLFEATAHADESLAQVSALRNLLLERIAAIDTFEAVTISPGSASPYITCVSFPGFEGAVVMRMLGERGVVVGSGSACTAESGAPSHVLTAMGYDERTARGGLRVSLGDQSTEADIETFIQVLRSALASY